MLGYLFGWTTRNQQPSATEFTTLFSTILGGTVLTLLGQLQCPYVLPVYIIGVVAGYVIYLVLLHFHWNTILVGMNRGTISRPPLLPWNVPPAQTNAPIPAHNSRVVAVNYDDQGRIISVAFRDGTRVTYSYTPPTH